MRDQGSPERSLVQMPLGLRPSTSCSRYRGRTVRTSSPGRRYDDAGAECARRARFGGTAAGPGRHERVTPTTAPNRSTSAAAGSLDGRQRHPPPRWRSNPSASTVGTVTAHRRRPRAWPRARRSSSAAGNRIQSSSGSTEEGAARLSPTRSSRGAHGEGPRACLLFGPADHTTSVRGCAFATTRP